MPERSLALNTTRVKKGEGPAARNAYPESQTAPAATKVERVPIGKNAPNQDPTQPKRLKNSREAATH